MDSPNCSVSGQTKRLIVNVDSLWVDQRLIFLGGLNLGRGSGYSPEVRERAVCLRAWVRAQLKKELAGVKVQRGIL